jgi:ribonuclease HI
VVQVDIKKFFFALSLIKTLSKGESIVMIKLYTDAATNNNSGNSAGGILIVHQGQQIQKKVKLQAHDNHHAEFEACFYGFQLLQSMSVDDIIVYYTDSKIVYESLNKHYAKHYQSSVNAILQIQNKYPMVINNWLADVKNEGAHHLANQALHSFY